MQVVCGIILSFPRLYPTGGQITHALLSRLPLYHCGRSHDHARLACIKRAASVHPEPGSNSLNENLTSFHYSAVKEPSLPVARSLNDQRVRQLYPFRPAMSIPVALAIPSFSRSGPSGAPHETLRAPSRPICIPNGAYARPLARTRHQIARSVRDTCVDPPARLRIHSHEPTARLVQVVFRRTDA